MMKNLRGQKSLCLLAWAICAIAVMATVATPTIRADIMLFQDTFDVGGIQCDITENIAAVGRQSGTIVDNLGPINYWTTVYWGNVIGGAYPDRLLNYNNYSAAPLINFNGYSQNGLAVDVDVNCYSDVWHSITIGDLGTDLWSAAPNVTLITMYDAAGSGLGLWQLFENGSLITGGALPVDISNQAFHHYKAVLTDPTTGDADPFNGTGQTDVAYYVDGSLITTYTAGAVGGLSNAYVHQAAWGWFNESDNLTVTQIPEPSTLVLLALPGLAILWFRLRKK